MSHIARIELEIYSLEELRRACTQLGLTFCEGQQTYEWYGRWVGDAELPEGLSVDDPGKCDHAIKVPGATYEIGIKKIGSKYQLLYDYWNAGKLEKVLGKNLGKLKQASAIPDERKSLAAQGEFRWSFVKFGVQQVARRYVAMRQP